MDLILKRFEEPDEVRVFEKGKFELVHLGGMSIGRASYQPGWKWSVHVGAATGAKSCQVEHVRMVLSGKATAAMDDGRVFEMKARPAGFTWEQFTGYLAGTTHPRRVMMLDELANVAAFAASDKASGMTGVTLNLTMGSLDD